MSDHGHGDGGPNQQLFLIIFGALCACTAVSFIVNAAIHGSMWPLYIIMAVAVLKATLVCTYFMHLKWDWPKVYFIMFPVVILAIMMMLVLLPDTVLGWHHE